MFLSLVPKTYFTNREFSFTLKDDIYIRYQSFGDQQEMEKEIQKRCPYKIDIGAVFTHRVGCSQLYMVPQRWNFITGSKNCFYEIFARNCAPGQGCKFSGNCLNSGFHEVQIPALLFIFSVFWRILAQIYALFQVFSFRSAYIPVQGHTCSRSMLL